MTRAMVLAAAALAALAFGTLPAAAGTLDQQETSFGSAYGQIGIWDGDGVSPASQAQTFGWVSIPLASPAPVTAGGVYAIVLSATSAAGTIDDFPLRSGYEWAGVSGDPYAGGTHIAQTGATWDPDVVPVDLAFKTYVMPAYTATVQQPINADGSSVFRTGRGVVPVKFTLSQD